MSDPLTLYTFIPQVHTASSFYRVQTPLETYQAGIANLRLRIIELGDTGILVFAMYSINALAHSL